MEGLDCEQRIGLELIARFIVVHHECPPDFFALPLVSQQVSTQKLRT
jgi:hypothetical protein